MPKKGANINLKGYDDLFSTEESRAELKAVVASIPKKIREKKQERDL